MEWLPSGGDAKEERVTTNTELLTNVLFLHRNLNAAALGWLAVVRGKKFPVHGTNYFYEVYREKDGRLRFGLYAYFWNGYAVAINNVHREVPDFDTNPRFAHALLRVEQWLIDRKEGVTLFFIFRKNRTKR